MMRPKPLAFLRRDFGVEQMSSTGLQKLSFTLLVILITYVALTGGS